VLAKTTACKFRCLDTSFFAAVPISRCIQADMTQSINKALASFNTFSLTSPLIMILNMIQMPICTCFRMELTVAFLLELNCDRISILQSKYYLVSPKEQRTRSYEEAGWPKGESNFIRERNENSSIPVRRYSCRKLQSPD
jgi:hypothetical protein